MDRLGGRAERRSLRERRRVRPGGQAQGEGEQSGRARGRLRVGHGHGARTGARNEPGAGDAKGGRGREEKEQEGNHDSHLEACLASIFPRSLSPRPASSRTRWGAYLHEVTKPRMARDPDSAETLATPARLGRVSSENK